MSRTTRNLAAALAFALLSAAATQSAALPMPPMIERYDPLPTLPPCFANQAEAIAWINAAYDKLLVIQHDQQAMSAYAGDLRMAAVDVRYGHGGTEAQLQADTAVAQTTDAQLAAARAELEASIKNVHGVKYCPGPAIPVRRLIGFAIEGIRLARVIDNGDRTHDVERDDGEGHTTIEHHLPH
jgi:hypothetical protein